MQKSVVVYFNEPGITVPSKEAMEKMRQHFKLDTIHYGNLRKHTVKPHGELFITDRHAVHTASNAGALYMGWRYACRQAGIE